MPHHDAGASVRRRPGEVRDAIVQVLEGRGNAATVQEITSEVVQLIGDVPSSSVRSYLRLNTPELFVRMDRAQYLLNGFEESIAPAKRSANVEMPTFQCGPATLYLDDCNKWLERQEPNSIHAVV